MKNYTIRYSQQVIDRLSEIATFIDNFFIFPSSLIYVEEIRQEIDTLSYMADAIPKLQWRTEKKHHANEKRLLVKNGKFTVFFHTFYDFVIIDDIVPSGVVSVEN